MPFRTAISGLKASQIDLNVIGNNIANVGTNGYKQARAEFQDVFAVTETGASDTSTGAGVQTSRVARQFTQGNVTFTDNALDLSVSGEGFFILEDTDGSRIYSRAGAFGVDRDGFVVNSNSQKLMAFSTDASGTITGVLAPMVVDQADTPPVATANSRFGGNLDAQAALPASGPFDPLDSSTFNNTTATTIFDSLGGSHLMQFYFVKAAAPNTWDVHTLVDGASVSGPEPLVFDTVGSLAVPAGGAITVPPFVPAPGTLPLNLTVDYSTTTQFGGPFGVNLLSQDGIAAGRLATIDIDRDGVIFARFTNGLAQVQGQVALGNFANPQGLQAIGNSNFTETFSSGAVLEGGPGSASLGLIQSGALEDSNVDLSDQLVRLIIAQRNFQANTEVISAADAVTQAVINIR